MPDSEFGAALQGIINQSKSKGISTLDDLAAALNDGRIDRPLTYGGATMCTEIQAGQDSVIVDMGSGIRDAGTLALQRGQKEFHILLTHMHWDHLLGLPFFLPVHSEGSKVHIHHIHKNAPEFVKIKFNGVNFPLTWEQLKGTIQFHQQKLYKTFKVGGLAVTPFSLDHPGGSFGYRVDRGSHSVAVAVDGEFKRRSQKELGKDLPYYQNLDLLLFDSQYDRVELESRFDWGHCTPTVGVEIALREGVKTVVFAHHDPWATTHKLTSMQQEAADFLNRHGSEYAEVWAARGRPGPRLIMGHDGLVLDLHKL